MASFLFNSILDDNARGLVDFDTDTFKIMLVTSSYTPNKKTHSRRSSVTNEVSGTGYTAGGATTTVTVTPDNTNDKVTVTFGTVSWPGSTLTARGAVVYKSTGTAANDPVVGYIDFNGDITSTGGTFSISPSTITYQN